MKVAFACGAIAAHRESYRGITGEFCRHCQPDRVGGMRGERGCLRGGMRFRGGIPAVRRPVEGRENFGKIDTPAHDGDRIAVGGEKPVGGF